MQSVKGSSPCIGAAALAVAVALVAGSRAAAAHPHVWIDARFAVIFDGQQRMAALRQSWRFDEFYSLFAVEGLDKDRSEEHTSELQSLLRLLYADTCFTKKSSNTK